MPESKFENVSIKMLKGPVMITGDLRSVVDTGRAAKTAQLAPTRLYAGLFKSAPTCSSLAADMGVKLSPP